MARYKDVDKLIEMYERAAEDDWNKKTAPSSWAEAFECAIADIDDQPTADVVPRSEVEKLEEYIDDLNDSKEHLCVMLEEARADVAREIFEEIETCLEYEYMSYLKAYDYTLLTRIEELKKKYTEK
jgi:hypothetical protein